MSWMPRACSTVTRLHCEQNDIIEQILSGIKKATEKVVDPAIKAAANTSDLRTVTQWGYIDTIMNEAIMANVRKLRKIVHEGERTDIEQAREVSKGVVKNITDSLDAWKEAIV